MVYAKQPPPLTAMRSPKNCRTTGKMGRTDTHHANHSHSVSWFFRRYARKVLRKDAFAWRDRGGPTSGLVVMAPEGSPRPLRVSQYFVVLYHEGGCSNVILKSIKYRNSCEDKIDCLTYVSLHTSALAKGSLHASRYCLRYPISRTLSSSTTSPSLPSFLALFLPAPFWTTFLLAGYQFLPKVLSQIFLGWISVPPIQPLSGRLARRTRPRLQISVRPNGCLQRCNLIVPLCVLLCPSLLLLSPLPPFRPLRRHAIF